jgi:hypothetical protein
MHSASGQALLYEQSRVLSIKVMPTVLRYPRSLGARSTLYFPYLLHGYYSIRAVILSNRLKFKCYSLLAL